MNKLLTRLTFSTAYFAALYPLAASAACDTSIVRGSVYQNPISTTLGNICTIPDFLYLLVDLVFLVGVPIIVIFIIYAGFLFVKSGDNESELAKSKTVFTWTLIGALVLLGAKAISAAIQGTIAGLQ